MKRRRGVLDPKQLDAVADGAALPRGVVHYLVDVLRLRDGDVVELADGSGRLVEGRISRASGEWALTDCEWSIESDADVIPVTLLVGLLKPKRWRLVIEKAVELGVGELAPILTQHTAWRPRRAEVASLTERWNRIALDASKQCRRTTATRVSEPIGIVEALRDRVEPNRLVAQPGAESRWKEGDLTKLAPTVLLVGPEGGLSNDEVELAHDAGFTRIALSRYPLRTETAVVVLVSLVRDRLGFTDRELGVPACR